MVTWISHRGLKGHAVENTKASFKAAVDSGFLSFECDLRVTRDDSIVLSHDIHFGRLGLGTTDIATLDRSTLQSFRFADGSRPYFFDEFMDDFAGYSWVFDIKPEHGVKTIKALEKWILANKAKDWVTAQAKFLTWKRQHEQLLLSFLPQAKCYAHEMECWQTGLLNLSKLSFLARIKKNRTYAIPPRLGGFQILNPNLVSEYHKRGALVVAFLPQNPLETRSAVASGVDEILTDGLPIFE